MSRRGRSGGGSAVGLVAALAALQSVAAVFFIADAIADRAAEGFTPHLVIEATIAAALVAGVAAGAFQARAMLAEARRKEAALAIAAGALSEVVAARFRDWNLTPAEADVAAFALKGFDVAEIATFRNAAAGTVRAQLARVYEKAGVNSRSGLASLFLEDLLGPPAAPSSREGPRAC
jgi:DNA-binding CsgD family transcriptional regulator